MPAHSLGRKVTRPAPNRYHITVPRNRLPYHGSPESSNPNHDDQRGAGGAGLPTA